MLLATEGLHGTATSDGQKNPHRCLSSCKQGQVNPWTYMRILLWSRAPGDTKKAVSNSGLSCLPQGKFQPASPEMMQDQSPKSVIIRDDEHLCQDSGILPLISRKA